MIFSILLGPDWNERKKDREKERKKEKEKEKKERKSERKTERKRERKTERKKRDKFCIRTLFSRSFLMKATPFLGTN